jgi:hypothetical protein
MLSYIQLSVLFANIFHIKNQGINKIIKNYQIQKSLYDLIKKQSIK